jgi:hypothetical protein
MSYIPRIPRSRETYAMLGEQMETHPWFLADVTSGAAIEVDNFLLGRSDDFTNLRDFSAVITRYEAKEDSYLALPPGFPYHRMWRVLRPQNVWARNVADLCDIITEFNRALRAVPTNRERLPALRQTLVELSREFILPNYVPCSGRNVA